MSEYDCIVLGGGTGNRVASAAAEEGLNVALVERDRLGGTCLNRGCNPSKQLIHHANVVETIRAADAYGIAASLDGVAFEQIVDDVTESVTRAAEKKARRVRENSNITFYQTEGRFVDDRTVEVADGGDGESERISAETIVLAGGSRPLIPDSIDGTEETDFLTSADALRLSALPDRLVIVGGGYVAVEMAHFFSQMGAEISIVGHGDVLIDREDRAVAERVTDAYREEHDLNMGYSATEIDDRAGEKVVTATASDESDEETDEAEEDTQTEEDEETGENEETEEDEETGENKETAEEIEVTGDRLLIATGRRPNTDIWDASAAGIETDDKGFVETDEYLRTSVDGIYAMGDIAGNHMFKHSGDKEAEYVVENAIRGNETAVEYPGMAHAIFGSPQVGSLGQTEDDVDDDTEYETGTFAYDETALGAVMARDDGFAKVLVGTDGEVLGCHVVGPEASTLIHEVSTAVAAGADAATIAETIHVHPALSEVVQGAFRDVEDAAPPGV